MRALLLTTSMIGDPEWDVAHRLIDDIVAEFNVDVIRFTARVDNELPFLEHRVLQDLKSELWLPSIHPLVPDLRDSSQKLSRRWLITMASRHTRFEFFQATDGRRSIMRWQLTDCDLLLLVKSVNAHRNAADSATIELALELDVEVTRLDYQADTRTRIRKKEPDETEQ